MAKKLNWDNLTPIEQYQLNTWFAHEAMHNGTVSEPAEIPDETRGR